MRLRLFRHHSNERVNAPRAPGPTARVTLRLATREDDEAVSRLAALYDRPRPSGPLLLAEVDGELQAALTLTGTQELLEPFRPSAGLVELLALRAQHLHEQMTPADLARVDAAASPIPVLAEWRSQHESEQPTGSGGMEEKCLRRQLP
jgi:hypothetical protein